MAKQKRCGVTVERCEVRYYTGHGAPGTPMERIEQCTAPAAKTLRAGPHLLRVGGMPETFHACAHHARVMIARGRAGLTVDAVEVA